MRNLVITRESTGSRQVQPETNPQLGGQPTYSKIFLRYCVSAIYPGPFTKGQAAVEQALSTYIIEDLVIPVVAIRVQYSAPLSKSQHLPEFFIYIKLGVSLSPDQCELLGKNCEVWLRIESAPGRVAAPLLAIHPKMVAALEDEGESLYRGCMPQ